MKSKAEALTSAVGREVGKLLPVLEYHDKQQDRRLGKERDDAASSSLDVKSLLDEVVETSMDLNLANKGKWEDKEVELQHTEQALDQMEEMKKYQGVDALKKVILAVTKENWNTGNISQLVFKTVKPKTRDFRSRIGQVFQDMNFALNLDAVDQQANSTMQEEISTKQRLLAAQEGLEGIMHEAGRQAKKQLDEMYMKTKLEIENVQAMSHLSAAEKEARIREIKAEARRQTQQLMIKTQSMIQREMRLKHGIETKSNDVQTLVKRAESIAQGDFHTTPMAKLKEEMAQTKQGVQDVYDRYVSPFGSLLEEGEEEHAELTPLGSLLQEAVLIAGLDEHEHEDRPAVSLDSANEDLQSLDSKR